MLEIVREPGHCGKLSLTFKIIFLNSAITFFTNTFRPIFHDMCNCSCFNRHNIQITFYLNYAKKCACIQEMKED